MSILKSYIEDVATSFDKNKINNIKNDYKKIAELNDKLSQKCKELEETSDKLLDLENDLLTSLNKKDIHTQNMLAKKEGYKSAAHYKLKMKLDISKGIKRKEQVQKDLNKYKENLLENKKVLKELGNSLAFFKNVKITTFMSIFVFFIEIISYTFLLVGPSKIFDNLHTYIIYMTIMTLIILSCSIVMYFNDKHLLKKLEITKPQYLSYIGPTLIVFNVLFVKFTINNFFALGQTIIYVLLSIFICYTVIKGTLNYKDNNNYYFPSDFTILNLSYMNYTGVTLLILPFIKVNAFNISIKIIFAISTLIYALLFIWEAKTNKIKQKDGKYFIFITLSLLSLGLYIMTSILNFTTSADRVLNILGIVCSICGAVSGLYKRVKKPDTKE